MCGIAGIIKNGISYNQKPLAVMHHRGPDHCGYYSTDKVWLGHTRLSILDLSERANQPMISDDGNLVLIFNGEIYNHLDIGKFLVSKGFYFQTTSDTETILKGFMYYGVDLFPKLNGIFSFCLLDKKNQKAFIVRDPIGVKPLYIYQKDDCFLFASEIKFFLQFSFFDKSIRQESFLDYIQFMYAPGNNTPFQHIRKQDPGTYIEVDINTFQAKVNRYYSIDFTKEVKYDWNEAELIHQVDAALYAAVERQLLSDVPLGFFVSGGLDSSLILAIAQKITGGTVKSCFTIDTQTSMSKEGFEDDILFARKVAKIFNVELHEIPSNEGLETIYDKIIWHLDEPQFDPANFHVYNICKAANQLSLKVLLGGVGGDDIFSGYRRHQALNFEKYFASLPESVKLIAQKTFKQVSINHPLLRRAKRIMESIGKSQHERMVDYFSWISLSQIQGLLKKDFKFSDGENYYDQVLMALPSDTSMLNKILYLEMKGFLPDHNLNYTDKMSMANSIEVRVPFLDLPLVDLSFQLPTSMKMKGKETKYILKKVAEKYLPTDIIYRKKTGFGAPVRQWVKQDKANFIEERLLDSEVLYLDFFNKAAVEQILIKNAKGNIDASFSIFSLVSIESWLRQFYY